MCGYSINTVALHRTHIEHLDLLYNTMVLNRRPGYDNSLLHQPLCHQGKNQRYCSCENVAQNLSKTDNLVHFLFY